MKIQIHNFGPINFFKCDLNKDLHLIVGENNIGKSYAITVIYLVIKSLFEPSESLYFLRFISQHEDNLLTKAPKKVSNLELKEETDISDVFYETLTKILESSLVRKFQNYFNRVVHQ